MIASMTTVTIENVLEIYQSLDSEKRRAFLDIANEQENWTPSNDDTALIRQRLQEIEDGSAKLLSRDDIRASMSKTRAQLRSKTRTDAK
ncbi:MAG: hypothetical protein GY822_17355 [Deltaproteobacteria bacterium]|nr:hypothetical protein [Deltaproteobacteria bacterium]